MKWYITLCLLGIVLLSGCTSQSSTTKESEEQLSQLPVEQEEPTYFAPINYALNKMEITVPHKMMSDRVRWNSSIIPFYSKINESVNEKVIKNAIDTWNKESNGVIKFVEVDNPEKAYFTIRFAKGGEFSEQPPSKLIIVVLGEAQIDTVDTGLFNLTKSAEMVYTPTSGGCEDNITAIHELGHILGFAHTPDVNSVMFNSVDCKGKITDGMKQTLTTLYSINELPDLHFGPVEARKIGDLLKVNFTVLNRGLITSQATVVVVDVSSKFIEPINVPPIEAGKEWWHEFETNAGYLESIKLEIQSQEEFDKDNNIITLKEIQKRTLSTNIIDYRLDDNLRENLILYGKTIVTIEYNTSCEECLWQKSFLESFSRENSDQIILENIGNDTIETSNVTIESKRGMIHRTTLTAKYIGELKESTGPYIISESGRVKRQIQVTYENRTIFDPSETDIKIDLCKLMVKSPADCDSIRRVE